MSDLDDGSIKHKNDDNPFLEQNPHQTVVDMKGKHMEAGFLFSFIKPEQIFKENVIIFLN